jgi:hypothetical protein
MIAQIDSTFLRMAPDRSLSRLIAYAFFEGRPATTKGQWWNPVVFRNLRFALDHVHTQVDRPVFIVGMGRSGTTLLGRILAAHPDVGFLNEPKAMWHVIRDDEDIIGSYALSRKGRLYLSAMDVDDAVIRRSRALFGWYLRVTRSKRVVDKYPELIFRHRFVRSIFPDSRFLIAVRSPWSTFDSVASWSTSHEVNGANWWGVQDQKWDILREQGVIGNPRNSDLAALRLLDCSDDYMRAALEWVITMREAIALAAIDPQAYIVDYEQLTRSPRHMVDNILSFCELPASRRTETYAQSIVSTPKGYSKERSTLSRLPSQLVMAIEETWTSLNEIQSDCSRAAGKHGTNS